MRLTKNSKTNKKLRLEIERVKILESDKARLMSKLEEVSDIHKDLKKNYELETEKVKVLEEELNKDKDIWTSLKSRLGSKKDGEE